MKNIQSPWPDGLKKTKQRQCVLSVLENAEVPLSAVDIYNKIESSGSSVWLSTIYRILDLFVKKDLVIKNTVLDNEMSVYELNKYQHKHYAICLGCKKVIPMKNCPMDMFVPNLEDKEFKIMGHKIELYGYCKDCKDKYIEEANNGY